MLNNLLNNQKHEIRIGATYGPQENRTSNNQLKLSYKTIAEPIEIAKEQYQQVLLVGDFNVNIGNRIPGNKETLSNGERQLKRIIEKYNLNTKMQMKASAKGNEQESKQKRDKQQIMLLPVKNTWKPLKVWRQMKKYNMNYTK